MKVTLTGGPLAEVDADLLVVSGLQDGRLGANAEQIDQALDGALNAAMEDGAFKGRAYQAEWVYPAAGIRSRRVLLIGTGKESDYDARILRRVAAAAARQARTKHPRRVCLAIDAPPGISAQRAVEVMTDGALTGLSDSDLYKDSPEKGRIDEIQVWAREESEEARRALERGEKLAAAVNYGRWLGDEPGNIMTPVRVAEEAQKMAQDNGIECEILDEEAMGEASMNSLLSVANASQWPPRLVVLRYNGGGNGNGPRIGLVGKGVTFDTGGISIKPAADMHYMKYDMSGAAAVISAVYGLASMKSKANVIAVAGLVENMPGGRATRPGDVVRAANGKTIEIINTDAEGRLVLADALHYAVKNGAERVVDIATLTGAIVVALGHVSTAVMGRPQEWVDRILDAASRSGERLWQMPIFSEYKEQLKSNIADLTNTGGRPGGALTASMFLQQFVGNTPWAHLDIAGTAWTDKDNAWQTKGATGVMIRTLITLAEPSAGA